MQCLDNNTASWSRPLRGGPDNLPLNGRMRPSRQAPPQRLELQVVRPGRCFANHFFESGRHPAGCLLHSTPSCRPTQVLAATSVARASSLLAYVRPSYGTQPTSKPAAAVLTRSQQPTGLRGEQLDYRSLCQCSQRWSSGRTQRRNGRPELPRHLLELREKSSCLQYPPTSPGCATFSQTPRIGCT